MESSDAAAAHSCAAKEAPKCHEARSLGTEFRERLEAKGGLTSSWHLADVPPEKTPARAPSPSPSSWVPQSFSLPEGGAAEGTDESAKDDKAPLDSDHESEVDVFKVMTVKEFVESDGADEGLMSNDEDEEEEEDFTVHFVHHGKKLQDTMAARPDLLQQIIELQEAVVEMKGSLHDAVSKLGSVVDDTNLGNRVTETQQKCESNSAEILKLVLALRTEFSSIKREISTIVNRQDSLQKSVEILLEDRRSLASDLSNAGVISQHTRARLECMAGVAAAVGGSRPGSTSGSHSNDSGVALLLERAHTAFAEDADAHQSSAVLRTSDQDSLPEQPSLLVPSTVYEYVAGLSQPNHSFTSTNSSNPFDSQNFLSPNIADGNVPVSKAKVSKAHHGGDSEELGLVYDSDSSLTIAANKTISLSASLSQEMRVQDDTSPNSSGDPRRTLARMDSDGSDQSRELVSQPRRRRPLLGISSTALYHPTNHIHSTSKDASGHQHRHRHGHRKGDPRETQRYKVAKELLDTEKKYCKTLWTIQDVFAEPLKRSGILSNKDLTTLFPEEVYSLYDKHCLLQHQLRERLASWKWHPLIGDILSRFTDPRHCEILRLYTNYVNDFPEVLKTFHKLCRSSASFTNFIKNCLEQPACGGLDLGAFLLTPVQRVPRYILLMKQLLKHTEPSHPDYRHINACLERLRDFLARLNDAMEHSFRLVHTSLSPSATMVTTMSSGVQSYRSGRSPRRPESSLGSPIYSPASLAEELSLSSQQSPNHSDEQRSPQRSLSNAGPQATPRQRALHAPAGRSSSLPRTSLSSSDSPGGGSSSSSSAAEGRGDASPSRHRSRSESANRRPLTSHPSQEALPQSDQQQRPLLTARSVSDVMEANRDAAARWEDLAASEPSLLDPHPHKISAENDTQSAHNGGSTTHKLVTWTDPLNSSDDLRSKKKKTIKTSIKNMFTFKKRGGAMARSGQEEQIYWTAASVGEAAEMPPVQHYATSSLAPAIGDFLDEEGNPCSNV